MDLQTWQGTALCVISATPKNPFTDEIRSGGILVKIGNVFGII